MSPGSSEAHAGPPAEGVARRQAGMPEGGRHQDRQARVPLRAREHHRAQRSRPAEARDGSRAGPAADRGRTSARAGRPPHRRKRRRRPGLRRRRRGSRHSRSRRARRSPARKGHDRRRQVGRQHPAVRAHPFGDRQRLVARARRRRRARARRRPTPAMPSMASVGSRSQARMSARVGIPTRRGRVPLGAHRGLEGFLNRLSACVHGSSVEAGDARRKPQDCRMGPQWRIPRNDFDWDDLKHLLAVARPRQHAGRRPGARRRPVHRAAPPRRTRAPDRPVAGAAAANRVPPDRVRPGDAALRRGRRARCQRLRAPAPDARPRGHRRDPHDLPRTHRQPHHRRPGCSTASTRGIRACGCSS